MQSSKAVLSTRGDGRSSPLCSFLNVVYGVERQSGSLSTTPPSGKLGVNPVVWGN